MILLLDVLDLKRFYKPPKADAAQPSESGAPANGDGSKSVGHERSDAASNHGAVAIPDGSASRLPNSDDPSPFIAGRDGSEPHKAGKPIQPQQPEPHTSLPKQSDPPPKRKSLADRQGSFYSREEQDAVLNKHRDEAPEPVVNSRRGSLTRFPLSADPDPQSFHEHKLVRKPSPSCSKNAPKLIRSLTVPVRAQSPENSPSKEGKYPVPKTVKPTHNPNINPPSSNNPQRAPITPGSALSAALAQSTQGDQKKPAAAPRSPRQVRRVLSLPASFAPPRARSFDAKESDDATLQQAFDSEDSAAESVSSGETDNHSTQSLEIQDLSHEDHEADTENASEVSDATDLTQPVLSPMPMPAQMHQTPSPSSSLPERAHHAQQPDAAAPEVQPVDVERGVGHNAQAQPPVQPMQAPIHISENQERAVSHPPGSRAPTVNAPRVQLPTGRAGPVSSTMHQDTDYESSDGQVTDSETDYKSEEFIRGAVSPREHESPRVQAVGADEAVNQGHFDHKDMLIQKQESEIKHLRLTIQHQDELRRVEQHAEERVRCAEKRAVKAELALEKMKTEKAEGERQFNRGMAAGAMNALELVSSLSQGSSANPRNDEHVQEEQKSPNPIAPPQLNRSAVSGGNSHPQEQESQNVAHIPADDQTVHENELKSSFVEDSESPTSDSSPASNQNSSPASSDNTHAPSTQSGANGVLESPTQPDTNTAQDQQRSPLRNPDQTSPSSRQGSRRNWSFRGRREGKPKKDGNDRSPKKKSGSFFRRGPKKL